MADPTLARRARPVHPGRGRRVLALLAALAVVAVTIGVVAWFRPDTDPVPQHAAQAPVTTVDGFPGTPPDGVSGDVLWASPALAPGSPVTVTRVGDSEAVALVTSTGSLTSVDAESGATRWSVDLPDGPLTRGPDATRVDAGDAVLVQVGDRVIAVSALDGSSIVDARIPQDGHLVLDGRAPLVRIGDEQAATLDATGLHVLDVPAGATALAAREDGVVLAGGPQGWWHLRPTVPAGPVTPWEQMGTTADRPTQAPHTVAALGSSVVLLDSDPARSRLFVHEDGDGVRASFQGDYVPGHHPVWAPSPSGTWGVLGRSLVDLEAGEITDLGAWETVLVADDRAYGLAGGVLHIAGPGRPPTPVATTTALVEAGTGPGVIVRAETEAGPRVWLLRRAS